MLLHQAYGVLLEVGTSHYKKSEMKGEIILKDEIAKVLSDESLTTNEEKVDAISKALATLVIPKDKFNEQGDKLREAENRYNELNHSFEDFKRSKMTDEEKVQAEKESSVQEIKQLKTQLTTNEVVRILEKAGLTEEDYKDNLQYIVSDNAEESKARANFLVQTLQANTSKVEQQTKLNLLGDTPKPIGGTSGEKQISNLDEYQQKYAEAIQSKDTLAQAKYLRLIQEEQRNSQSL